MGLAKAILQNANIMIRIGNEGKALEPGDLQHSTRLHSCIELPYRILLPPRTDK